MMRYVQHNFWYKVAAVTIATLLWSHVRSTQNPVETKYVEVPLMFLNKAANLEVVGGTASVRLGVRVHKNEIQKIRPEEIAAQVDLGGIKTPGSHKLKIACVLPSGLDARDAPMEPLTATVELEEVESRSCPVQVTLDGPTPRGLLLGKPKISPNRVKVSGRASLMSKVRIVFAKIAVADLDSTFDKDTRVYPVDRMGLKIPSLQVEPSEIHVRMEVGQAQRTRSVRIEAQVVGIPAAGYEIDEVTSEPGATVIAGDSDRVDSVAAIQTEKIDISGAKVTTSRLVPLHPPSGIKTENARVRVTVALRRVAPSGKAKSEL